MKRLSLYTGSGALLRLVVISLRQRNLSNGAQKRTKMEKQETSKAYHKITAEEAKEMMDQGDVTIVDVRTEEEYAEKHIPGAVLVPNESIGEDAPAELPDKNAVLLLHCRTGIRSKEASDKLVSLGYKHYL